jgi:sugar lactone lactonase YvrE
MLGGVPEGFLPNGFALLRSREFLVANLDPASGGGVWKIDRDRRLSPWVQRTEGQELLVTNSVSIDAADRVWISVSTRRVPRQLGYRAQGGDGFIVRADEKGARIAADGIGYTNECRVDPKGQWLYVNETFGRRLSRFQIRGLELGPKEVICEFSDGDFPDGLVFDSLGAAWVTCVVSNRVIRVAEDGSQEVILDASDRSIIDAAEANFRAGKMDRADIELGAKAPLGNVSSLAFGGCDLRTVYLGSLANRYLATFRSPIAGAQPPHWFF